MEIDGRAFAMNVAIARTMMAPGALMYQVVKADGYGFGVERAVRLGVATGVEAFCAGTIEEAMRARAAAPDRPVLLFTACPPSLLAQAAREGVVVTVNSLEAYDALETIATASFMFEFDCGFGRFGLPADLFDVVLAREKSQTKRRCVGGYTHFGSRASLEFDQGLQCFDAFATKLKAAFGESQILMAAASHGLIWRPGLPYPAAHPGSLLYGMLPLAIAPSFQPVLHSVKSQIIQINRIEKARTMSVGYGSQISLPAGGATGVFPLGWNDGLSTGTSLGRVLVRGRPAPTIARTLFHSIVDLTGFDEPLVGEEVVLIGSQNNETISLHEAAEAMAVSVTELHFRLAGSISRGNQAYLPPL